MGMVVYPPSISAPRYMRTRWGDDVAAIAADIEASPYLPSAVPQARHMAK
jgi:hypothetical protein